ncbi:MAG: helix-turn-helix transcriptional regulator [Gallionella sp.]|nr:helix-turn-helix transcriptional regulator [Acidithiobacillus sp.]MDD4964102.1 helix-turn-helix transcriptional regulator [Gallionella sp.]
MSALIERVQILRDAGGHPAFAVVPFAQYQALISGKPKAEPTIPGKVVDLFFDNGWTATRAWREYLHLTQAEVSARMGISQAAFAQMETAKRPRKTTIAKIAQALGLEVEQLRW